MTGDLFGQVNVTPWDRLEQPSEEREWVRASAYGETAGTVLRSLWAVQQLDGSFPSSVSSSSVASSGEK